MQTMSIRQTAPNLRQRKHNKPLRLGSGCSQGGNPSLARRLQGSTSRSGRTRLQAMKSCECTESPSSDLKRPTPDGLRSQGLFRSFKDPCSWFGYEICLVTLRVHRLLFNQLHHVSRLPSVSGSITPAWAARLSLAA